MGHYQQWLHYREVEQQLQTQLETLKQELLQLQARAQGRQEVEHVLVEEGIARLDGGVHGHAITLHAQQQAG